LVEVSILYEQQNTLKKTINFTICKKFTPRD